MKMATQLLLSLNLTGSLVGLEKILEPGSVLTKAVAGLDNTLDPGSV